MKTKIIKIIILLFFIITFIFVIIKITHKQNVALKTLEIKKSNKIKPLNATIDKNEISQNLIKLRDTTVILYFKDLSNVYNYKIIDKYYCEHSLDYYDKVYRIIKVYNKKDSLIQKINPNLKITPWYFLESDWNLKLSRSYITGKNIEYNDPDNYCGEIVVADLNFDGLEDFATPVDQGCDNGSHYAFYIQNKNNRFVFNNYLTENVMWFPDKINDSLKSFTNSVPCTIYGIMYQTFKYDTLLTKWKKTKEYLIDNRTGKLMK